MNATVADDGLDLRGEVEQFEAGPVSIRAERLLRIQGYARPEAVRPPIRRAAEKAARMGEEVARGAVALRRTALADLGRGQLVLEGGIVLACDAFDQHLSGCRSVVVFLLTAGPGFDERIRSLLDEDDLLGALFLENAGWLAVEDVTRQLASRLRARVRPEALQITRRMGPGYTYQVDRKPVVWALDQQAELFRAFRDEPLPIELLEGGGMSPKMSRSGLYGLRQGAGA
jgi:hypothetical protein